VPYASEHIIDVRADEQIDEDALDDYLDGRLPGTDAPITVRQFGGGKANLTYLLDYGTHEYVLRRPPMGPVAESSHDMEREYTVLSALHKAFPLAPEAFLFCDDTDVIGDVFFVMERRHGAVVRETLPDVFADVDDAPQRMTRVLVDTLADLHAVDPAAVGLSDLGDPDGFIERQVEGWHRRWHQAKPRPLPLMDAVYHWLRENLPESGDGTLVHNDYKLDNLMLDPVDPGQPVAVFDWDMCTLGDPLSDLGALLTYWVQPDDPAPFRQFATMPVDDRFPSRQHLVARYAERSGRDVSALRFYHTLGLFRLTVIVAQISIRYERGQTEDERFAGLEPMIEVVAQSAYDVAQGEGLAVSSP
jgi:aminoglycoside phosphotransferase (APT) family kinase protein